MFGNVREQIIARNMPGMAPQSAPQAGGGIFGPKKRKTSQRVAGYLADALAGLAGRAGPYAGMIADERAQAEQEAAYQRQRADQYTDWQRKQEYERANPAPRVNDTVADFEFIRDTLGPDQAELYLRNRADPPQFRQGPDGQFYRIETGPPAKPVGRLTPIEPMSAQSANFMTAAQYQAIVQTKGPAAAEAWRRQHNIEVR